MTSPPYFGLRDYGVAGQIGLEPTPAEFVEMMVGVFREIRRVLRSDGTLWLNLGDTYAAGGMGGGGEKQQTNRGTRAGGHMNKPRKASKGLKPKDLIGIPWSVAFALRADGWWLRQDIIWSKPNPMPESVTDRCTKAHEYLFLLSKGPRYYYDADAIAEPAVAGDDLGAFDGGAQRLADGSNANEGRNYRGRASGNKTHKGVTEYETSASGELHRTKAGLLKIGETAYLTRNRRSVWTVPTVPFKEAHFATFPPALIEPCILAGCPKGGTVLDPFGGAGTTGLVADRLGRNAILIELNPQYAAMAENRIRRDAPMLADVVAA